jgi:hypothetical protein
MRAPQERFRASSVGRGIDSHRLLHVHQMSGQNIVPAARSEGNNGEQIELGSACASGRAAFSQLNQKPAQPFRPETEQTGIAFPIFGRGIAFASLQQIGDAPGVVALEVDLWRLPKYAVHHEVRRRRSLTQAQYGVYGCRAKRHLVAPQNHSVESGGLGGGDLHRVSHAGGRRLNGDAVAARGQPLKLRLHFIAAIRGEHEHGRAARREQQIEQPFENRTARDREQDFGAVEAEAEPLPAAATTAVHWEVSTRGAACINQLAPSSVRGGAII